MRRTGWILAAALVMAAAAESRAQVAIGNPYNGQGITIGRGGVTLGNAYTGQGVTFGNGTGYAPGYGGYGYAPGTTYYGSNYVAPGYSGYSTTTYSYARPAYGYGYAAPAYNYGYAPAYGYRSYSYPVNRGWGGFGRRGRRW